MENFGESTDNFAAKTPVEVGMFLKEKGIPDDICDKFEDQEIDGAALLELTNAEVSGFTDKLGIVKICRIICGVEKQGCSDERVQAPEQTKLLPNVSLQRISSPSHSLAGPSRSRATSVEQQLSSPGSPTTWSHFSPSSRDSDQDSMSICSSASTTTPKSRSRSKGFTIPDTWRPSIMASIKAPSIEDRRKNLTPSVRNEIVRDLVTQVYAFMPKPTKAFLTDVAKQLVQKYNFMKDRGEGISGYGSWEKKLIDRVHNTRDRKRSGPCGSESPPPAKRGRPKLCTTISRYPPINLEDDHDDVAYERNAQALSREMDRELPRKEVVLPLIKQTCATRREYILSDSADITFAEILQNYPALALPFALELEVDLILKRKDVVSSALRDWKTKWVPAVQCYSETLRTKSV